MSAYAQYILKRDKFLKLFRSSGPNPMVKSHSNNPKDIVRDSTAHTDSTRLHHLPTASVNARIIDTVSESAQSSLEIEHVVTNTAVKGPATNTESSTIRTKPRLYVFNQNVNPPSVRVSLPKIRARIDSTPQLALCIGFINNDSDTIGTVDQQRDILQDMNPDTTARLAWIEAVKQDPIEQDHIRWLGARMVDEFAKGASKDSTAIAEMVLLGPVLDNETYRRLLEGFASALADSIVLDVDLLQGLVQLVQSNPSNSLLSTDLIKILRILRIRLQDTRQQSSEHLFHLTLAVSRVSDIMADHKAKGLNHVVEHEPLSRILVGLKGCSEPYLIYQTCYAFQALQYVLGDETALQRVLRHSSGVIGGLAKVSAVFKLDVSAVIEGLGNLQETLGGDIGIANTVYGGALSLLESGQGVFDSLKVGYGSSQQRPWYSAIRAANAFARSGQLKDLNQLICEAPCRDDPLFQWGICQLLGEIASDTIWDNVVRQGAITLLGELHKNDVEWGQDESVIAWMQNIFRQLSIVDDQVVKNTAYSLLKDVKQEQVTVPCVFYPLRNQLPLPTSSPILVRVQNIPYIEYDLHLLKIQRLEQSTRPVYIPPLASLNTTDKDIFPLMEKVQEFLQSKRQVMLVLGDSGAGKSTFNGHLEHRLWMDYKPGDSVPLLINLPAIDRPDQDLITKQLRIYNFRDDQIQEFKLHRRLILICDGYDESQQLVNLHKTNMLNTPGQWNTKMIVSCRTQFLGRTYLDYFKPQPVDRYLSVSQDLFQEAVIAPFSKDQIKSYVEQYAQDPQVEHSFNNSEAAWSAKVYMDKLVAIPNVMDLAKNPFLLTLALKTLPSLVASNMDLTSIYVTRARLYDMFVDQWLEKNQLRLQSNIALSHEDRRMMDQLVDAGFVSLGNDYSTRLAQAIFDHQDGNPLVHYVHLYDKKSWMVEFFGLEPEARLLRESSPLTRAGNSFSFFHRSLLEYFFSRTIYNPTKYDEEISPQGRPVSTVLHPLNADSPLFKRDLLQEPSVIAFLCDRVKLNPRFKDQLRAVIDLSKTDSSAAVAATNAITILVRADVSFNSEDLRGIKVPGADLSNGQFDSAQFQGADLRGVNLSKSWLRQADMSDAYMENVRFGELPYLEMDDEVYSCTYSPDGKMLGVGLGNGIICVYDTSTWTQMHHLDRHVQVVRSIAFSPSSQRLVSGSRDNTVRLWDTASGEELLVMEGHSDSVNSVTISPCGNLIASASSDKTVRLWDAQTGEKLFVLEDHSASVEGVKYSPDGCHLVSGDCDGTIRLRNPMTGEPLIVLDLFSGSLRCVSYSSDGRWIATGDIEGHVQLWDAVTLEPGPVLNWHTDIITGIDFSLDGQWIASSGYDYTVGLWDASTNALVTVLTGHNNMVTCCAFSPDSRQIASGGCDRKVRLWEVGSGWASLDLRDGCCVMNLVYCRDGGSILSYDNGGIYRQWDAATGTSAPIPFEMPNQDAVISWAHAPDGCQFAFGYEDCTIRLWDRQIGAAGPVLKGHSGWVYIMVYSPCCRWIVSADTNDIVHMWDLCNVELPPVLVNVDENSNDICAVVFSSIGDQFAIGTGWDTIYLFGTQSRECLGRMGLEERILPLVYSPNDQYIAIGTRVGGIYLWDLQSKEPNVLLEGHKGWVRCIAYSTCGQWMASASEDKTVGVWHRQAGEVKSWSKVHSISTFFEWVSNVAWNPVVPMELVTSASDDSIQMWRVSIDESGKVVIKMVWGSNLSALCTRDATFENAVGLSSIYQELLIQRGAICPSGKRYSNTTRTSGLPRVASLII